MAPQSTQCSVFQLGRDVTRASRWCGGYSLSPRTDMTRWHQSGMHGLPRRQRVITRHNGEERLSLHQLECQIGIRWARTGHLSGPSLRPPAGLAVPSVARGDVRPAMAEQPRYTPRERCITGSDHIYRQNNPRSDRHG